MMKAAVITRNYGLEIWDVPVPEPGDYEVLCKTTYGATCAGTDLRLMRGGHPILSVIRRYLGMRAWEEWLLSERK